MRLVLASASPRRADLLRSAGIAFDAMAADIDERRRGGEGAEAHAVRLAREKAEAVEPAVAGRPVLAADTIVVVDDVLLGKPADDGDAARMLRRLSGRSHQVLTAVCLIGPDGRQREATAWTAVAMARLSEAEIAWYVRSGEPRDKAGAYAVQGLASRFVRGIDGSYSNVVGLPVALVCDLCKQAGLLIS